MVVFLLDENVNRSGVIKERCAEEWDIEIYRVHDVGLIARPDREILDFAREHDYVIVTGNVYEFRAFQQEILEKGESLPGIIYIPSSFIKNVELIMRRIAEVAYEDYHRDGEWWVRE